MKTATMPSLRVTPQIRQAAESVLEEGESLSSFLEQSLLRNIEHRTVQREFLARGLASKARSEKSGRYLSKSESLQAIDEILSKNSPSE